MLQSVVRVDSFIVDSEGASPDAPLVLCCGVSPEFSGEDVQYLLPDPPSFGERGKCEVVRVDFSEACNDSLKLI